MFREFLTTHRSEIVRRARIKVMSRSTPPHVRREVPSGVALFLDQLVDILHLADGSSTDVIQGTAAAHGAELLRAGCSISQVVHDYGDVCQAITEIATEIEAPITVEEFHTLNRCLDDAIAGAVTEYSRLREVGQTSEETQRSAIFAHELRNKLGAAILAFTALKSGKLGIGGSTAAVVDRNLRAVRDLIDSSLAEVRIDTGKQSAETIGVASFLDEITAGASLEADVAGVNLSVAPVDQDLEVCADRAVLVAAVGNLIQNAFKFSRAVGRAPSVARRTTATADRVRFSVHDECGGLPAGDSEDLFRPYTQRGVDRKGLGLGLSSSRKGIEATGGYIDVENLPGTGCVFTIDVPRSVAR